MVLKDKAFLMLVRVIEKDIPPGIEFGRLMILKVLPVRPQATPCEAFP
jgi:hypothetical protein